MASITLDFDDGQIGDTLEPDLDDLGRANIVIAERRNGSQATATDTDGPLGTQAIGPYKTRVDVNPFTDSALPQHAHYHLVLGTDPDPRYPRVVVDLDANPSLATSVSAVDIGDLIALQSIPADLGQPEADTLALGYTEIIGSHRRIITFNTRQGGILSHVGKLDDDANSCLQTSGAELDTAITAEQVSFAVATTSGPLFTTSPPTGAQITVRNREIMNVTGVASSVSAAFGTDSSNGWSAADTGQTWSILTGTVANFAVSGGAGVITLPTGDTDPRMIVLSPTFGDFDYYVPLAVSQVATGQPIVGEAVFRTQDSSNFYRATFGFTAGSTVDVSLVRVVAGAGTSLASTTGFFPYVNNVYVYLWIQCRGTTLRVAASSTALTAVPNGWTLTATDAQFSSGQLGFRARLVSGNTNVSPQVSVDNVTVFNPQTLTVTRDPDQRMTHPDASSVKAYRALRITL